MQKQLQVGCFAETVVPAYLERSLSHKWTGPGYLLTFCLVSEAMQSSSPCKTTVVGPEYSSRYANPQGSCLGLSVLGCSFQQFL